MESASSFRLRFWPSCDPLALGFFPRLRLPAIVLEIILGIVIGPSGLGWVKPDLPVSILSLVGLAFLLFLSGLEIDVERLRGRILKLTALGFAVSFASNGNTLDATRRTPFPERTTKPFQTPLVYEMDYPDADVVVIGARIEFRHGGRAKLRPTTVPVPPLPEEVRPLGPRGQHAG